MNLENSVSSVYSVKFPCALRWFDIFVLMMKDISHYLFFPPSSVTREAQTSSYHAGSQQHSTLPTLEHDSAHVSQCFFSFVFHKEFPVVFIPLLKRRIHAREMCDLLSPQCLVFMLLLLTTKFVNKHQIRCFVCVCFYFFL